MNLKKSECFLRDGKRHIYKYILFLGIFCAVNLVQGQIMSIAVPDAEVADTSVAPSDDIIFRVRKSASALSLPSYTVNYSVSGTTTNGVDHTNLIGEVIVPGGTAVTFVDIVVRISDDDIVEELETLTLTLEPGTGYSINTTRGTATAEITSDDVGVFSVEVTEPNATEENQVRGAFLIRLDKENGTGGAISLPYTLAPAATDGAEANDYTTQGQAIFTFPNGGQMTQELNIIPVDDTESESDETLVLTLGVPSNSLFSLDSGAPTGSVLIVDNDCEAGNTAPNLDSNPSAFCDVRGVNLNSFFSSIPPSGLQVRWSLNPNPTTAAELLTVAAASSAPADTYYAVFWSPDDACASPATGPLVITINQTPVIGTATSTASCNTAANGGVTTLNLNTTLSGSDTGGTWTYVSGPGAPVNPNTSGVVDFNNSPDGDFVFQYELVAVAPCATQTLEVTIPVNDCNLCVAGITAPNLNNTDSTFCGEIDKSLNDFVNEVPPPNTQLRWATSAADPTNSFVPDSQVSNPSPGTYHGFFYDAANDCTSPTVTLVLALNVIPDLPVAQDVKRCGIGDVTLMVTPSGSVSYNWYANATGGTVLDTGESFVRSVNQTTTFYVEATENGCTSASRTAVTATIITEPSAGIPVSSPSSCNNPAFGATTLDLDDLLTDEDIGVWEFTSGPIEVPKTNDNIVDFNGRPAGDYVYTFSTNTAEDPCVDATVAVGIAVSSCDTDTDGDGLLGGLEAELGTNPDEKDSDGDMITDDVEVGPDTNSPLDEDGDGIIDALDSNLADSDNDGVVDQLDPANNNLCIPDNTNSLCEEPIDLEVSKEADNLNALIGDELSFTITVKNLGERIAKKVVIGDFLDSGFEYISDVPSSGGYDPDTGQWLVENMATGASETLTINVTVVEEGSATYMNTATLLESNPLDNNPDNDVASVTVALGVHEPVDLLLEKFARIVVDPAAKDAKRIAPFLNEEILFTIRLTKKTPSSQVTQIRISDILSDNSGFVFDNQEAEKGTYDPLTGIWSISENLAENEVVNLFISGKVTQIGTFTNTAKIISPVPSDNSQFQTEETVTIVVSEPTPAEDGFVFNQFSPNADGTNDFLVVRGVTNFTNTSIEIYNRYGHLVFEDRNMTDERVWDGTWKENQAPASTYYYILNLGDGTETRKGWIQLIR